MFPAPCTLVMAMESLLRILADACIQPQLVSLLDPDEECVLVGGALRDWLLGRPVTDFDFATPGDPTLLAQRFARLVGGSWFVLDPGRRQSRVVRQHGGDTHTYDFAPYRGPELEADLRGRDFTVNAIALVLDGEKRPNIHDPLFGRSDLEQRRLRDCSVSAFRDDPLRVLRGVRHAVVLGFGFEAETFTRMRSAARSVREAAPERIRNELAAIFAQPPVERGLSLFEDLALYRTLFGVPGHGAAIIEGIRLASFMESALSTLIAGDASGEVAELCRMELDDGFCRSSLLKLGAFLRGYAPLDPVDTLQKRLRLSRRNVAVLRRLLELPPSLSVELPGLSGGRGRALWADQLGPSPADGLLFLALFDKVLRLSPELLLAALHDHRVAAKRGRIPDLVDGRWLNEQLGLEEGPAMGYLLGGLRRAEMAGEVRTAEEARTYLSRNAKKMVDKDGRCSYNP